MARQRISTYEAAVEGKRVRMETHFLHEERAALERVFRSEDGAFITQYISTADNGKHCPPGYRIVSYPAVKVDEHYAPMRLSFPYPAE
jgi:hypothetical protein